MLLVLKKLFHFCGKFPDGVLHVFLVSWTHQKTFNEVDQKSILKPHKIKNFGPRWLLILDIYVCVHINYIDTVAKVYLFGTKGFSSKERSCS